MPPIDLLDVLALLLGLYQAYRRTDVRQTARTDFPGASDQDFAQWRSRLSLLYSIAMASCLLKLVVRFGFLRLAMVRNWPPIVVWRGGFLIDVSWLVSIIVVTSLARLVRREGIRRGIAPDLLGR